MYTHRTTRFICTSIFATFELKYLELHTWQHLELPTSNDPCQKPVTFATTSNMQPIIFWHSNALIMQ